MSGLIWAGIGKGIADAGQTFGTYMAKDIEDRRKETLEALREERQAAREMARDERLTAREEDREIRKDARTEAAALKDADIYAKAEAAAPGVGEARRFEKFKKDLGQTDMAEEDLRTVFKDQYDQTKVVAFEGADRYVERYSKQKEDVLSEIRRRGGSSGLINQAVAEVKGAREAERAADKLAFDEKRLNEVEQRRRDEFKALLPIKQQTADASTTRANKPAGGSGSNVAKVRSTKVDDQGNVVAIMSDGTTKSLGIKSGDFNKQISTTITAMGKADYSFNKLPEAEKREKAIERLTGGTGAPKTGDNPKAATISALPKGATQIGTSGGKPVYQTPDGKKFIGN